MDSCKSGKAVISWWFLVLGVDLFLILITVLRKYPLSFPGKGKLSRHFDLAVEGNWAVWWSGASLLLLALVAYELYCLREKKAGIAWLALAIVFAVLSLDEIGSLHERVMAGARSLPDLLPFAAVLGSLVAYALITLWRSAETRRAALWIGAAFLVYGGVAFQEHLEFLVEWPAWFLGIRTAAEEGSELLGTFFLFLAIIPFRSRDTVNPLSAMVPNPFFMKRMSQVVLAGFIVHSAASILASSIIDSKREDGNPLVWYPVAVFFLLFSAAFWRCLDPTTEKPRYWGGLSIFCLICSAGFIYDPTNFVRDPCRYLPAIGTLLPEEYLPSLFLLFVATGLLVLSGGIPDLRSFSRKYFYGLLLVPPLPLLGTYEVRYLASGLLAYLAFDIFQRGGPKRVAWIMPHVPVRRRGP